MPHVLFGRIHFAHSLLEVTENQALTLCPTLSPRAKSMFGQQLGASMMQAPYNLCTRKHGNQLHIMSLPPTDKNLYLHIRLSHLHMLFGRQYKQGPPNVSITENAWEVKDRMTCPCI